jgi:hypothetical protein
MMAAVVAAAVRDRQAEGPASFSFGWETLRLGGSVVAGAARRARATRLPHNQARPLFQRLIIAALAERYAEAARELAERLEADVADVVAGARSAIEADLASLPVIAAVRPRRSAGGAAAVEDGGERGEDQQEGDGPQQ